MVAAVGEGPEGRKLSAWKFAEVRQCRTGARDEVWWTECGVVWSYKNGHISVGVFDYESSCFQSQRGLYIQVLNAVVCDYRCSRCSVLPDALGARDQRS